MEKILIVEDDKALSNGIALALKAEGYIFLQTQDLAGARETLEHHEITRVILDLNLPDGNGLELLQEIKEKQEIYGVYQTNIRREAEKIHPDLQSGI